MIELSNASFGYAEGPVINNLNLHIEKGSFTSITGGNGAGKTTMVKLISGLLKPTSGTVRLCGTDTREIKAKNRARFCGFLFQNPDRQICKTSVYDEIGFSLSCIGIGGGEADKIIRETAGMLELDPASDPFSLSKGERQKVALASVLAAKPEILILDEPTTGLDYRECMRIMDIVADLNNSGTTVIMVSHDMEIVADFAKRVIVFEGGKIILDGDCRSVLTDERLRSVSSVLPPQAAALAQRLGGRFSGLFTTEEIISEIAAMKGIGD